MLTLLSQERLRQGPWTARIWLWSEPRLQFNFGRYSSHMGEVYTPNHRSTTKESWLAAKRRGSRRRWLWLRQERRREIGKRRRGASSQRDGLGFGFHWQLGLSITLFFVISASTIARWSADKSSVMVLQNLAPSRWQIVWKPSINLSFCCCPLDCMRRLTSRYYSFASEHPIPTKLALARSYLNVDCIVSLIAKFFWIFCRDYILNLTRSFQIQDLKTFYLKFVFGELSYYRSFSSIL